MREREKRKGGNGEKKRDESKLSNSQTVLLQYSGRGGILLRMATTVHAAKNAAHAKGKVNDIVWEK